MILLLDSFMYSISCLVKKCMNYSGAWKFFYKKKLLKKQCLYRNKKLSIVLSLFSDLIIQTNNLFKFRDLWNFTMKCIGVKLKLLVFFFVPLVMWKAQKVESIYYIQSDCEITSKKSTDSSCVFTRSGKVRKGGKH